jgi:hypothetical protein
MTLNPGSHLGIKIESEKKNLKSDIQSKLHPHFQPLLVS